MLRGRFSLGLLVWSVLLVPVGANDQGTDSRKPADGGKNANSAFERLKKLVGDWELAGPNSEATKGKIAVKYRLTAAGSTVVETLFPDDDKEMVTVYHPDQGKILLTHYCSCGNQPRMRGRVGDRPDELIFEFAGGNNLDPAKDLHMHGYKVRFVDADHLHGEWEFYRNGKSAGKHIIDLVRKKA
jgi:hypothetical protein